MCRIFMNPSWAPSCLRLLGEAAVVSLYPLDTGVGKVFSKSWKSLFQELEKSLWLYGSIPVSSPPCAWDWV